MMNRKCSEENQKKNFFFRNKKKLKTIFRAPCHININKKKMITVIEVDASDDMMIIRWFIKAKKSIV